MEIGSKKYIKRLFHYLKVGEVMLTFVEDNTDLPNSYFPHSSLLKQTINKLKDRIKN